MRSRLGMDGQAIGAGGGEIGEIGVGRRDHQMDVEGLRRDMPDRLHHLRTEGNIRHEMAVHDVDVDDVAAGRHDVADRFAEPREIAGENGGEDFQRAHGLLGLGSSGRLACRALKVRPVAGRSNFGRGLRRGRNPCKVAAG